MPCTAYRSGATDLAFGAALHRMPGFRGFRGFRGKRMAARSQETDRAARSHCDDSRAVPLSVFRWAGTPAGIRVWVRWNIHDLT